MHVYGGLVDWNGSELCFRRVLYLITGFIFLLFLRAENYFCTFFSQHPGEQNQAVVIYLIITSLSNITAVFVLWEMMISY